MWNINGCQLLRLRASVCMIVNSVSVQDSFGRKMCAFRVLVYLAMLGGIILGSVVSEAGIKALDTCFWHNTPGILESWEECQFYIPTHEHTDTQTHINTHVCATLFWL